MVPLLVVLADAPKNNSFIAIQALNAIDALGKKASPWKREILAAAAVDPKSPERVRTEYTQKLLDRMAMTL